MLYSFSVLAVDLLLDQVTSIAEPEKSVAVTYCVLSFNVKVMDDFELSAFPYSESSDWQFVNKTLSNAKSTIFFMFLI